MTFQNNNKIKYYQNYLRAVSAVHAAYHIGAAAIICVTTTGKTIEFISKYRPQCPTIAVTRYFISSCKCQNYKNTFKRSFIILGRRKRSLWCTGYLTRTDIAEKTTYLQNFLFCVPDLAKQLASSISTAESFRSTTSPDVRSTG